MGKPEAVALAQLLGRFGFGVEPDVPLGRASDLARHTGRRIRDRRRGAAHADRRVHRRDDAAAPGGGGRARPTVGQSETNTRTCRPTSSPSLGLTAGERRRLSAHLRWLARTESS